jgi:hypothetical protein
LFLRAHHDFFFLRLERLFDEFVLQLFELQDQRGEIALDALFLVA